MISPPLCRAARGWLGWSQQRLADESGVGLSTIRGFEAGRHKPIGSNMRSLEHALEDAEIVFVVDEEGRAIGLSGPLAAE